MPMTFWYDERFGIAVDFHGLLHFSFFRSLIIHKNNYQRKALSSGSKRNLLQLMGAIQIPPAQGATKAV
jgi:hypothetical protein